MLIITDHAVLRHMERVERVDVEEYGRRIEENLATPQAQRVINFAGDTECKIIVGGISYCLRDGVVTTCYPTRRR